MERGTKIFLSSVGFGWLFWFLNRPRIIIDRKDIGTGQLDFSMSVDGHTYSDTVTLNGIIKSMAVESKNLFFIAKTDPEGMGIDLTIGENLQQDGTFTVIASEWVKMKIG